MNCTGTDPGPQHFTGKERDQESGNDYFEARYYASAMGRFLSPDSLDGHLTNPQTLNKYVYVANNPLSLTDPTGMDLRPACSQTSDDTSCSGAVDDSTSTDSNDNRNFLPTVSNTATPAATVPLTLPPLAFPSLEGAGNLLGGFLDTLGDVLGEAAAPLAILADPASTANESQDTIQQPAPAQPRRPTADVRGKADQAATDAKGKLRCAYCGKVLTTEAGKPNSREYDHVTPHSQGGGRKADNIKDACRSCNRQKGPRTPEQWGGPHP